MRNGPYELIIAPDDYTGKLYRERYAYEHHVVYWQHTGHILKEDEHIHHRNERKRDNRFENLKLTKRTDHVKHHKTTGKNMVDLVCPICNKEFKKEFRHTHLAPYNKKESTCCSRSCSAKKSNTPRYFNRQKA